MKVYEFYFNPPRKNRLISGKEDLLFDTFCFEAKNVYEKRMGNLYITGSLKNILPQNIKFLEKLTEKIKEAYYQNISLTPEKSLRETLRLANEYLERIAKEGDVSWLGNLNFNIISLKNLQFNFSKVGDFKTLLLRKGHLVDIDKRLRFEEIEPYPLKVFGNIVSGKLAENDILLVLNKEIYEVFLKEDLLNDLASKPLREFTKSLKNKRDQLIKTSGICLLIALDKETEKREREIIAETKHLPSFKCKEVFNPFLKLIKKIKTPKIKFPKINLKKEKVKQIKPKLKLSLPTFYKPKKKITLFLFLSLVLIIGFLCFNWQEENKTKNYQIRLKEVEEKINQANSYFEIVNHNPTAKKEANSLYQEVWQDILTLNMNSPKAFKKQLSELEEKVFINLSQLNNLESINSPEVIFDFKNKELTPERLVYFKNHLYFYTPSQKKILKLNLLEEKEEIIEMAEEVKQIVPGTNSILIFSSPNRITIFPEGLKNPFLLQEFSPTSELKEFSSYRSNLYFLDNKTIIKYPALSETTFGFPQLWLSSEENITNPKSMTIDNSIWLLTEEGTIQKYYLGQLEKTITLDIFPSTENLSKILTNITLPYLYLLEKDRLIILNKSGELIKQYQSQAFNHLLDFTISSDGKTVWLLDNLKVYKIITSL